MAATPNYTEEQTAKIVEDYSEGQGKSVEEIAEEIGKSVRSVRSKLVKEGVYVASEKPAAAKRIEGPSKKELLNMLDEASEGEIDVTGLMGATKAAIASVLAYIEFDDSTEQPDELTAEQVTEQAADVAQKAVLDQLNEESQAA